MASVELHTLWLNDMADLSDYRSFTYMSKLTVKPVIDGEVRTYAGGRRRAIQRPGRFHELTATLPACTRDQLEWLAEKVGSPVLVRDDRGRKFYGVFFDVDTDEHQYDAEGDASLSITEITHSEAV